MLAFFALLETREVLEPFFEILVRPMKQTRNQKMKMKQRRMANAQAAALAARTTQYDNTPE